MKVLIVALFFLFVVCAASSCVVTGSYDSERDCYFHSGYPDDYFSNRPDDYCRYRR